MKHLRLYLIILTILPLPAAAQFPATQLVTQPVDTTKLVTLHGSVHPLAQPRYDIGMVNESTPAQRLLLVLNRPPDREAAFQQLLRDLHAPGSSSYHHWLTSEEMGTRFGPADADLDAVTGWLTSSGFAVNRVSKGRRFVEFSGTVGQVNAAFHTQIRDYLVNGEVHHANATEIQIPEALAQIVAGLSPLHDFRPAPQLQIAGKGTYDASARRFIPEFNLPSSSQPLRYGVAPADFYTEYDLNPLYSSSVTGAGVTIGIIDESNIDLSLVNDYRSVFGLSAHAVQVVLDGGDPGANSSDVESYFDVEMAGAVAPAATVSLYLSAGSPYQDPLALAALRAIEDNQADVLSISWGAGEQELGTSGNQVWNALWEQAAAQGQTVLVATGDYGQITRYELSQSGIAGRSRGEWTGLHAVEHRGRRHGLLLFRLRNWRAQRFNVLERRERSRDERIAEDANYRAGVERCLRSGRIPQRKLRRRWRGQQLQQRERHYRRLRKRLREAGLANRTRRACRWCTRHSRCLALRLERRQLFRLRHLRLRGRLHARRERQLQLRPGGRHIGIHTGDGRHHGARGSEVWAPGPGRHGALSTGPAEADGVSRRHAGRKRGRVRAKAMPIAR